MENLVEYITLGVHHKASGAVATYPAGTKLSMCPGQKCGAWGSRKGGTTKGILVLINTGYEREARAEAA
jgi:hypothetical protein